MICLRTREIGSSPPPAGTWGTERISDREPGMSACKFCRNRVMRKCRGSRTAVFLLTPGWPFKKNVTRFNGTSNV